MKSNYKKIAATVAILAALAAGTAGTAAGSVDDGAKANGLKVTVLKANGL